MFDSAPGRITIERSATLVASRYNFVDGFRPVAIYIIMLLTIFNETVNAILGFFVILEMGLYRLWHGQLLRCLLPPLLAVDRLTIN